jgi:uncharacterized UBP type Zn finger protein
MSSCRHLFEVREAFPNSDGCEDCLAIGGTWVHLRLCMACGHVGCCDQSPNRHATGHFRDTGHPVIRPITPPGERWLWCYVDQVVDDPDDVELEGADLG